MLLQAEKTRLLAIDMQTRLLPAIADSARIAGNCGLLLRAAAELAVPVMISEQYPQGLGHSVPEIRLQAGEAPVFEKTHFSCMQDPALGAALQRDRQTRPMILLCGVEAHVCVLQTALDLQAAGFIVFAAADACGSRTRDSAAYAYARMTAEGVRMITTEMALFEWLGQANTPAFRKIAPLLK